MTPKPVGREFADLTRQEVAHDPRLDLGSHELNTTSAGAVVEPAPAEPFGDECGLTDCATSALCDAMHFARDNGLGPAGGLLFVAEIDRLRGR